MSETQFTPGPWRIDGDIRTMTHGCTSVPIANYECQLAYVFVGDPDSANAHLIAAAPDLYEALKNAVAYADAVARSDGMSDGKQAKLLTVAEYDLGKNGGDWKSTAAFDVAAARAALSRAAPPQGEGRQNTDVEKA